ncbi:MAG: L-aspartate oxidase [Massiliimalia sp.]|jgi:L-aspartate oxidase
MAKKYDVVIVGSGVAGLYAALNLDSDLKILMVCKRELTLSNSALAQGGVAAVVDTEHDDVESHFRDTMIAGGQKNNPDAVRLLVEQGPKEVLRIMDYGVDFDKTESGEIHFTLEGGHSMPRILHHKDATGYEIVIKLLEAVKKLPNVEIMENSLVCHMRNTTHFSFDILKDGNHETVFSRFCIMASGGIGRVYEYTTNSKIATGDGIAMAYDLGARIKNLHLIQFHPTGFANKLTRETFLISESVRGEGAYLLNCNFERFMHKYDDRLELAPRDVVSRCIMEEAKATGSDNFYLDISYKDPDKVRARFPMIYEKLLAEGIDMTKDKIPVFPCHHYLMGGIDVDLHARTTVDRLYAAGECSHTGVHGNNRLASNSLLEALVFSRKAAEDINSRKQELHDNWTEETFPDTSHLPAIHPGYRTEIRSIMQHSYFVIPDFAAAKAGFDRICQIKKELDQPCYRVDYDYVEAHSLATVAYLVLKEVATGENATSKED